VEVNAALDRHPTWSPDGSRIAFLSDRTGTNDIWVIPTEGGPAVQLTSGPANDGAPDWSPDGSWIAYQSNAMGDNDIWVVAAGGGTPRRITSSTANDNQPDWSPDGSQIAFSRDGDLWRVTFVTLLPATDLALSENVDRPAQTDVELSTRSSLASLAPNCYVLHSARPNPSQGPTVLAFDLPAAGRTTLLLYDVSGRLVRTLLEETLAPGRYSPSWDGRDHTGKMVSPGVYFVRFTSGEFSVTRKLVRMR
jgi:Tol biopolymer transport system component